MTAAVLAFIFIADVDPNALLERVAARYAALKNFSLELRQNEQRATYRGSGISGTVTIRLDAGAGNRYYLREFRDDVEGIRSLPPVTIVNDGENVWRVDGRFPGPLLEEPGFYSDRNAQERIHILHGRFAMLDGPAMLARYVKTEKIRGRVCAVIEIESRLPEAPAMWEEKLWIDLETAAIHRSHFARSSNIDNRQEVFHRDYFVPPGQRPPDESLFVRPPAGSLSHAKPVLRRQR